MLGLLSWFGRNCIVFSKLCWGGHPPVNCVRGRDCRCGAGGRRRRQGAARRQEQGQGAELRPRGN